MMSQRWNWLVAPGLAFLVAMGCGGDGSDSTPDGVATYKVTGSVHDFVSGNKLDAVATVSTDGLLPPPTISVSGSDFTIENIPPHSVFHILAGSPPGYRATYNVATEVLERDIADLQVEVVSESYLAMLVQAFGVSGGTGSVLIGRLVDENGAPKAGVPGTSFELSPQVQGPFFLDANRQPAPNLSESSASGFFVLFDLEPGLARITAVDGAGLGLSMPDSPVAATAITLADVVVTDGDPIVPENVSFSQHVAPIFRARGCEACHDGGGIGKDLGGLHLNGAPEKMYKELAEERSPKYGVLRVNVQAPETSLLLTMPSREDPPDAHPNVTFTGPTDPDYVIILTWIREGALYN